MKISRILFTVVILGSLLTIVQNCDESIKMPIQTAADRVGA